MTPDFVHEMLFQQTYSTVCFLKKVYKDVTLFRLVVPDVSKECSAFVVQSQAACGTTWLLRRLHAPLCYVKFETEIHLSR